MLTSSHCPQHNCPLIQIGEALVCLLEHARTLLDQPIRDLTVDQGVTTLIFPGYVPLPLVGWDGNARATAADSADALLDVLADLYLCGVRWHQRTQKLELFLADEPGTRDEGLWALALTPR